MVVCVHRIRLLGLGAPISCSRMILLSAARVLHAYRFCKGFAMFSMTILVFLSFCNDFQIISWFSLDFVVIFIEIPVFTKKL